MILNGVLVIVDVIWLISVGSVWNNIIPGNDVWNSLRFIHHFAIFWSIINLVLKVLYLFLIKKSAVIIVLYLYR